MYKQISLNPPMIQRVSDGAFIPEVAGNNDYAEYRAWLAKGNEPEPYVAPVGDILAEITNAVQTRLDEKARERRYDSILSLCTYATSTVPKFAAEGQAGVQWRDDTWAACYALLEQFQNGEIEQPSFEDVLAALPELNWPQ